MISLCLAAPLLQTLVIGGGPSREFNQIAIESNVRYLGRILKPDAPLRVLFADGSLVTKSVQYVADKPVEENKVGPFSTGGTRTVYRAPQLPRMDGPALFENVRTQIAALGTSNAPALIYFTGHGSVARDLKVSQFNLWSNQRFAVPDLVDSIKAFPKAKRVLVLMVQCHSSDFANILYRNGDPSQGLAENRVCGFFASIALRPAAGCTPSVNEENYKDFSGYFLAALTGKDRIGGPSLGADFNSDGRVGMNEAFCWSLVNDDSIDTPVCTSDVLLKTANQMTDEEVFKTLYADVTKWANSAQKAALVGLSEKLALVGEDRLAVAVAKYGKITEKDEQINAILGYRFVSLARSVVLGHAIKSNPDRALRRRFDDLVKDEAGNPFSQ